MSTTKSSYESSKKYGKLGRMHNQISSKENELDSKTVKRNMDIGARLERWFPGIIIDEAITSLLAMKKQHKMFRKIFRRMSMLKKVFTQF